MENKVVKYVAELSHVREVSRLGLADFGFWSERLRGEGLTPVEHAGRAQRMDGPECSAYKP